MLVNQGMILGEVEFTGYVRGNRPGSDTSTLPLVSSRDLKGGVDEHGVAIRVIEKTGEAVAPMVIDAEMVEKKGDAFVLKDRPEIVVESRAHKMSKSRGNVINPDVVVDEFGADSLRLYEMFMGPLEAVKPWSMKGVEGVARFLGRVWRMIVDETNDSQTQLSPQVQDVTPTASQLRTLHRTIKAVTSRR